MLQVVKSLETPKSRREQFNLYSEKSDRLDKNRVSNTFYSTNCISASEKSFLNINEKESVNYDSERFSINLKNRSSKDECIISNTNKIICSNEEGFCNKFNHDCNLSFINNSYNTMNLNLEKDKKVLYDKFSLPFENFEKIYVSKDNKTLFVTLSDLNINNNYDSEYQKFMKNKEKPSNSEEKNKYNHSKRMNSIESLKNKLELGKDSL